MSLLFSETDERTIEIARAVYQKHFTRDPELEKEYDERRKRIMYDDILVNIGYLNAAVLLNDERLFVDYARWIYRLLVSLMKDIDKNRIKEQMIMHYEVLYETLSEYSSADDTAKAKEHIENAILATEKTAESEEYEEQVFTEKHMKYKKKYLEKLLKTDTRGAIEVVQEAIEKGVDLEEIYINILQEVMYQVGELWHKNLITVDKEHYCTSTTQMALSQFYPIIFSKGRKGYKIVACCVGSELHEMGMRMVSDLFELNGWDSIYLGAGVPINAVITSIKENKPDLVGFSVTMPQHLPLCLEYVNKTRKEFPNVKIAVGGRAFATTNRLWEKWDIDVYAENAAVFIDWTKNNIEKQG